MFQYHGWIEVRRTYENTDATRDELDAAFLESVRQRVQATRGNGLRDARFVNGALFVTVNGLTNHRGADADEILALYRWIAAEAPGSYGLLHVYDDEDPTYGNELRVFRLARGALDEHADALLSPVQPTVEDPFTSA